MVSFETFFRLVSYVAVFCGFLALWVSGTFGLIATFLFVSVLVAGWVLEGTSWQIGEKVGTALIVLALPTFYYAWKYQLIELYGAETAIAGILARMILALTSVKLLQKKSDRDWIFLYLMAFFEVLLAAGLSISALYVVTFVTYLLVMVCAVIAFEVRKTAQSTAARLELKDRPPSIKLRRLPITAVGLLVGVVLLAVPLFFMLPRVGGAGFGGLQGGLSTSTGFSDVVRLGGIGRIQQNDEVVMRVKIEGRAPQGLYFRGMALDTFDNRSWSKSRPSGKEPFVKGERDYVQVDAANSRDDLVIQTVYLEPLDTSILFGLPRIVAVQGGFPIVEKDPYGAISYRRTYERISYTVLSDQSLPDASVLRRDDQAYGAQFSNYLQLPDRYDRRIFDLAYSIASKESDRYDRAAAIEKYLQTNFGYTLEQKAGGSEPLSDFLFNVKEGHCEYFATAMAVMLRTQGIATRIVNGFHGGDRNDISDMTVVRQKNAHSWVEVYFPKEDVWVPFDPTPYGGGDPAAGNTSGISAKFNMYLEAMEAFWIQNFVAYDNQGQKSLLRSFRNSLVSSGQEASTLLDDLKATLEAWWADVRGDNGASSAWSAVGTAALYLLLSAAVLVLLGWLVRKVVKSKIWGRLRRPLYADPAAPEVDFYARALKVLADKGFVRSPHQTPLEFAVSTGLPGALTITEKYQSVRFGERDVTASERRDIDSLISELEEDSEEVK